MHPNTTAFGFPALLELPQQIQRSDGGDLGLVGGAKEKERGPIRFGRAHLASYRRVRCVEPFL